MIEVYILPQFAFDNVMKKANITDENVELEKNHFFISINEPDSITITPYFKDHENVKVAYLYDVDEDTVVNYTNGTPSKMVNAITPEQALDIVRFIEKNKDRKYCFVHCAGGVSRSGAVGTFINDVYGEPYEDFKRRNSHIQPNITILNALRLAYNKMISEHE